MGIHGLGFLKDNREPIGRWDKVFGWITKSDSGIEFRLEAEWHGRRYTSFHHLDPLYITAGIPNVYGLVLDRMVEEIDNKIKKDY